MSKFYKTEQEGSFTFCLNCPSNINCCTRMKSNSSIDNAIVFNTEIIEIEKYSGVAREEFLQENHYPKDSPYQNLKHVGHSGCYFHKNGHCEIYPVRPLDCRLFPFDIIEDDEGELQWIVYTNLCPVDFDYLPAYERLKSFFDMPEEDAWTYSEGHAPGMETNRYIELDRVYQKVQK